MLTETNNAKDLLNPDPFGSSKSVVNDISPLRNCESWPAAAFYNTAVAGTFKNENE